MGPVGRLAPTPSGGLHLGNLCAFAAAWLSVRKAGGRLLLRIEDIDRQRSRPAIADGQRRDLEWLGLGWDEEVTPQSQRDYAPWLGRLAGRVYRCTCTRKQLRPHGGVYPGTCRDKKLTEGTTRFRLTDTSHPFHDRRWGPVVATPSQFGDPVLVGRDGTPTYNLAVVADDIADGVSEVVRGADLRDYTGVQIALWQALGATPPAWLHAPLILGPDGRKLSKSHGAMELASLREIGWSPADVWRLVLPWLGLGGQEDPAVAALDFDPAAGPRGPLTLRYPSLPSPSDVSVLR